MQLFGLNGTEPFKSYFQLPTAFHRRRKQVLNGLKNRDLNGSVLCSLQKTTGSRKKGLYGFKPFKPTAEQ